MKRKIILFASAVVAAMAMTTSAYAAEILGDVDGIEGLSPTDAAMILEQALSKDYAAAHPEFDLSLANVDRDLNVTPKDEITANDAALVYKLAMEQSTLKLTVETERYGSFLIADFGTVSNEGEFEAALQNVKIRDLVETKIAQVDNQVNKSDSLLNSNKNRIENARQRVISLINRVKFKENAIDVIKADDALTQQVNDTKITLQTLKDYPVIAEFAKDKIINSDSVSAEAKEELKNIAPEELGNYMDEHNITLPEIKITVDDLTPDIIVRAAKLFGVNDIIDENADISVTLKDQAGWDIAGWCANPLLVNPIYKDDATIIDLASGKGKLDTDAAKDADAKVSEVSLPNNTDKLNADIKDAFAFAKKVYGVAVGDTAEKTGVVKTAPSADDVIEAKNRALKIAEGKKFSGVLELSFDDTVKKSYTFGTTVADQSDDFIRGFDGLDYNTSTVGDVYDKFIALAGVEKDSIDTKGNLGTIRAKAGIHDVSLVLAYNK